MEEDREDGSKREIKLGSCKRWTKKRKGKGKGAYCHGDISQHC
jgi:hypothetical protein